MARLPDELPTDRKVAEPGPTMVLTLGILRPRRAGAFLRASARAGAQLIRSPGLRWATGMGRPPFVGTCSVWNDVDALTAFAYGQPGAGHADATRPARPFHPELPRRSGAIVNRWFARHVGNDADEVKRLVEQITPAC